MQEYRLQPFDINHTLYCGQVFRYFKIAHNSFCVISADKWCVLTQFDDCVKMLTSTPDYFYDYLDTKTDYTAIEQSLSKFEELATPIKACTGLRILRQDLTETIVSFIVSACNNIKRITNTLNGMCASFGDKFVCPTDGMDYYTFPNIDVLKQITQKEWASFGAGYRAPYLVETTNVLASTDFLNELKECNIDTAFKKLCKLKGVGAKVANCILLFGLGYRSSFPVDTWIFNSLKTNELNTNKKVFDYYTDRYKDLGGYAQQYVFYFNRSLIDS